MKISNETKVGIMAAISITVLILGYSYLQGNKLFKTTRTFYVEYGQVSGLSTTDDVLIKGYKIGKIQSISLVYPDNVNSDSVTIVVAFAVEENIEIPNDSEARIINTTFLEDKAIEIILGDSSVYLKNGDFLVGTVELSLQQQVSLELQPVKESFERLVSNIDSVIARVQGIFDTSFQVSVGEQIASIRDAINSIRNISGNIDNLIEIETGRISEIMSNIHSISKNLEDNQENITGILNNLTNITDSLSKVRFVEIMGNVDKVIADIAQITGQIQSGEGTLGALINDRDLYDNLKNATARLDSLIIAIKENPRAFVPPIVQIGGKRSK